MPVWVQPWMYVVGAVLLVLVVVFLHDVIQRGNPILRNFPVIGWGRFLLIKIGPELRQYIVANNREEQPFNRSERNWIYRSANRENNYFGFGTDDQLYGIGYPIIKHSSFPLGDGSYSASKSDKSMTIPCAKVIGAPHGRAKPYRPSSIINISAMSFGSLGQNAISALNLGAAKANCYHNTGEGGVSKYHKLGGDIVWQLGTGYFGARTPDGGFDLDRAVQVVNNTPSIKMIEIKLSQGAKPGKGGVLPGSKVTAEIAETRGCPEGKSVLSPNSHREFQSVDGLIDFVESIANATGLPVGVKAAVGQLDFWHELAERMKDRNEGPDYIAIDGGEGGTGAAPLTFADHVALPFKVGFVRVFKIFSELGIADHVTWIGAGKLGFPDRAIVAMALGCDLIYVAREAMLSVGCIQAQECHTGKCPAGVATHSIWLQRGLDPKINAERFQGYIEAFRNEVMAVTLAAGYEHPGMFTPHDIELSSGPGQFSTLYKIYGYDKKQFAPNKDPCFKRPDQELWRARLAERGLEFETEGHVRG